ncbi:hypothetical protein RV00_GL002283 [Enterococcus devriesei]|uniref:Uncharacterized protein n=1 Tax=Enterococcus devriesei TaxID=319970 RepID=A0A1L8SVI8_9ENTE|nr:hypothetical protein RV00_GL002283 [Enterococcus devriesei]
MFKQACNEKVVSLFCLAFFYLKITIYIMFKWDKKKNI